MTTIAKLLEVEDKKEQVEKVEELLKIASTPVIDLIIRNDGLDEVTLNIIGGDVAFETLYKMLDLARQAIHQQEIQMAVMAQHQQSQESLDTPEEA